MMMFSLLALSLVAADAPSALYVSKLGASTDGRTWETAFATIQAALEAVPEGGGRRIVVRPDTYFEANLAPAHPGAAGEWNELVGDVDGKLGSGTSGWVVIDSGDPGQQGFKSYDWWGPIRAYSHGWSAEHTEETFSAIVWDRWRLRGLYVTGGDAGLFFDGTNHVEPFSVTIEDCVSIGRAFGASAARSAGVWAASSRGPPSRSPAAAAGSTPSTPGATRPPAISESKTRRCLTGPTCCWKTAPWSASSAP
ncbi:MAG: hypothetical protein HYU66_14610 [Armatimonadetes bacterium]|nr:hypothetical protein [Armatimonadota bacterium]